MNKGLIYKIKKEEHNEKSLKKILDMHAEIKFVSLMTVDLFGNVTDERIPINLFIKDIDKFLHRTAVQTDGSSVDLPKIAEINNAKVDMVIDKECDWFIDYNEELFDDNNEPIGTIIIPSFLYHNGSAVDSRSILKNTVQKTKQEILYLLDNNKEFADKYSINPKNIKNIDYTVATELEFWVKTPNEDTEIEDLKTSQGLHEQYWNKIDGSVRTAIEQCLLLMDKYELNPEMGHKEVGGVKPKISFIGKYNHIMEQVEIDWKYSNPLQAADNLIFIKEIVRKTFLANGLETTFLAKPIENVAGSGMHVHLGMIANMADGSKINLFNSIENNFLSAIGFGAVMGMLKNYEVMSPFISSTDDSLRRLKPGYEAPVSIVASLGDDIEDPSRNRTVLIGLIRDNENPFATRFELRSPNPMSNIYLVQSVSFLSMLDGIKYAIKNNKTEDMLLKEISKKSGEQFEYLDIDRQYRSEEDVYEHYTEEERNHLFGKSPATVYENALSLYTKEKLQALKFGDILTAEIIDSFKQTMLEKWKLIVCKRKIKQYLEEIKMWKNKESQYPKDIDDWNIIDEKSRYIYKTTYHNESLFLKIQKAFDNNNWKQASDFVIELEEKMEELRELYSQYKNNII